MKFFKSKASKLKARLEALESYLGLAWAEDGYGDFEHVEKKYGELPHINEKLKELETKKGTK